MSYPDSYEDYTEKRHLISSGLADSKPGTLAFVAHGTNGNLSGVSDVVDVLDHYGDLFSPVDVFSGGDKSYFDDGDPVLFLKGPTDLLFKFSTIVSGILFFETADENGWEDINKQEHRLQEYQEYIGGRDLIFAGGSCWRFDKIDDLITCFPRSSFDRVSIPYISDKIKEDPFGYLDSNGVSVGGDLVEAFEEADTDGIAISGRGQEITDAISVYYRSESSLEYIVVDPRSDQLMQGASEKSDFKIDWDEFGGGDAERDVDVWYGTGVTVSGVHQLRQSIDRAGLEDVDIYLSFRDKPLQYLKEFSSAEYEYSQNIYDGIIIESLLENFYLNVDLVEYNGERVGRSGLAEDIDVNQFDKVT